MTAAWTPSHGRVREVISGTLATVALVAVLFGIPFALIVTVGWPLPRTAPDPSAVTAALRYGQISPTVLLNAVAIAVWLSWSIIATGVVVEVTAVVRGTVTRTMPMLAGLQPPVARVVATALLLTSLSSRAVAMPMPLPVATTAPATAPDHGGAVPPASALDAPSETSSSAPAHADRDRADAPVWRVRRRDSLWSIAQEVLGDGRRWSDIRERNVGRVQPDGATLERTDVLIRPGWLLTLPDDAVVSDADRHAREIRRVTVADGDHLWGLAERYLGDGQRWDALFERNRGRPQPDGRRLTDPDVLEAGWSLELPEPGGDAQSTDADADEPSTQRPVRPTPPARHRPAQPIPPKTRGPIPPTARTSGSADAAAVPTPDVATSRDGAPPRPAVPAVGGVVPPTDTATTGPASSDPTTEPTTGAGTASDDTTARGRADGGATDPRTAASRPRPRAGPPRTTTTRDVMPAADRATPWPPAIALLATGLVAALALRRRAWLRRRDADTSLAPVDAETAELERWLRALAEQDLRSRIAHASAAVDQLLGAHDSVAPVAALRLGDRVGVLLTTPTPTPPGFEADDDARWWWLTDDPDTNGAVDTPAAAEPHAPVCCGTMPAGDLVLLDVLRVGSVTLSGRRAQVAEALTSWTAELAADDRGDDVDIVVTGAHHHLVERFPRVTVARDLADAVARVRRLVERRDDDRASATIVLCGTGAEDDDHVATLLEIAEREPWIGIVAGDLRSTETPTSSTGPGAAPGHPAGVVHLVLDERQVTIGPVDVTLDAPRWLTPDDWDRFGDLLRQPARGQSATTGPQAIYPVGTSPDSSGADVLDDLTDIDPTTSDRELGGTVQVLGVPRVDGWPDAAERSAVELVVCLTIRGPADAATLRSLLWPGRGDADAVLDGALAAARGLFDDESVLVSDGRYRVRDSIESDLDRFRRLTATLDRHPTAARTRRMTAALALVRGEPFADAAGWAHADGLATAAAAAIADVAHRLAMLALAIGDIERAEWAATVGLRGCPGSELLQRDRMRLADARGDHAALDRIRTEISADSIAGPARETEELYRQLRADGGTSGAVDPRERDAS